MSRQNLFQAQDFVNYQLADIEPSSAARIGILNAPFGLVCRPHVPADRMIRPTSYRFSNGFPSLALPFAPLRMSYTAPCASALGTGTMTQVSALSVIGSSGIARM